MGTASEAEVTLFTHKFSGFSQRVTIGLLEKGIPFKPIYVDLYNKPKELLEANPLHQKIPVIIHNGNTVIESLIILEYLDDAWPETVPLMPKDAVEKAKVRFWSDYIHKGLAKIIEAIGLKHGSSEKQASVEEIIKFLKMLEEAMSGYSPKGPFFTGDKFGFIDVVLCPLIPCLPYVEEEGGVVIPGRDEIPRFYKWIQATKVHPSVKSTLPSGEDNREYFKEKIRILGHI